MAPYRNIPDFRHLTRRTGRGPVARLSSYIRNLPPGDRFIAGVLGLVVALVSVVSIVALERSFLVQVPVEGGSLTEGVVGAPRYVNPLLALSDTDRDLTSLVYAGLMGYDQNGNLVPVLAESYRVSEDGKTYEFTLRNDAKFSDGTTVTAEDVAFTINKAKDPALKSPVLSNWSNIDVEAIDARTVQFTLPSPYIAFLSDATIGILPEHLWGGLSTAEFPFSPQVSKPVGAGPFMVGNVVQDSNGRITQYDVVANSSYVLGRPYLDRISFKVYADYTTLQAAMKSGAVESAYGIAQGHTLTAPYARIFGVFFNAANDPVYADAGVRHALSTAIDRPNLVQNVLGGYAVPSIGPVPAGFNTPDLAFPDPATRVDRARQYLADAGWKWSDASQSWTKGSQTLSVTLTTSNVPELKQLATQIQTDWNAIGVPVTVQLSAPGDLTQSVIRPRNFDALLFGEVVSSPADLFAFWDSGERKDPGLNIANYANPKVDALLEDLRSQPDQKKAADDLAQVNALIASDFPAAFTHTPDFVYSVPSNLRGVHLGRVSQPTDRLGTARYWYRNTELIWPWFARHPLTLFH